MKAMRPSASSLGLSARSKLVLYLTTAVLAAWSVTSSGGIGEVLDQMTAKAPWLLAVVVISRSVLIVGVIAMAAAGGWRLRQLLTDGDGQQLRQSRLFWAGFWLSTVGASTDATVIVVVIVATTPPQAWGVAGVAAADLVVTFFLRASIYSAVTTSRQAVELG